MKKIPLLMIFFLLAFINIFGQPKEIKRSDFYSQIRLANEKKSLSSRREKMKLIVYSKSAIDWTEEEISEYILPDKRRYFQKESRNGKTTKLELIKIGNKYYQRKNNDKWTKEKQWNSGFGGIGIPVPISSSYTIEKIKVNSEEFQVYRFYAIYNEYSPKEGEEAQTYWEQKTWINNKGFPIKEEMIMGKPQSKEIISQRIYEYEYNPKDLKIEAPIK